MNRTSSKRRSSKSKRKTELHYTPGELNKLVDSIFHPLCDNDKRFILVDGFLHALIEQNPPVTVRKFVKYNLREIVEQLSEKRQS